jgi:hypothetical protein
MKNEFTVRVKGYRNPALAASEALRGLGLPTDHASFDRVAEVCGNVEARGFVVGDVEAMQKLCELGNFTIRLVNGVLTCESAEPMLPPKGAKPPRIVPVLRALKRSTNKFNSLAAAARFARTIAQLNAELSLILLAVGEQMARKRQAAVLRAFREWGKGG